MLMGVTSFGCALHRQMHSSHSYLQPTERGNGGDFDFLVEDPWHDPVLTAHLPDWGFITNDWWHNSFAFMH